MNSKKIILALFIWTFLVCFSANSAFSAAPERDTDLKRFIISFNTPVSSSEVSTSYDVNKKSAKSTKFLSTAVVFLTETQAEELRKKPNVLAIDEDKKVKMISSITESSANWGFGYSRSANLHQIGNLGQNFRIGVLDSGIDLTHTDISSNYSGGYDFVNQDNSPQDDNGHGTHVSGIIAAAANNEGVIGIAPEVKIHSYKVLDESGYGYWGDIIAGIDRAIADDIKVLNVSLGTSTYPGKSVEEAFKRATDYGITIVAAAGNSGNSIGSGDSINYPAKFNKVIGVGAIDSSQKRGSFSSTGPAIDFVAPGVNIVSDKLGGGVTTSTGTSMASPYVAGMLALITTPDEITNAQRTDFYYNQLKSLSTDLGATGFDNLYGNGALRFPPSTEALVADITSPIASAFLDSQLISFESRINFPHLVKSLSWSSSITGVLSSSPNFQTKLKVGNHSIKLTILDINDRITQKSINLTITEDKNLVVSNFSVIPKYTDSALISADILKASGAKVYGAYVNFEIYRNGSLYAAKTVKSNLRGNASLLLRNIPTGCYDIKLSSVVYPGYTFHSPQTLQYCR